MKKLIFAAALALVAAATGYGQTIQVVSDAEYNNLVKETKASHKEVKTVAPQVENGFRGLHITLGASYGKDVNGTASLGYQLGRNGGFEFGGQLEAGNRFAVEAYAKQNLGRYHAESLFIPALKIGVGASEQDMWCGASTDPEAPQGVKLALACPRMGVSAIAEFDLKWKPSRKEPRLYVEFYGGCRLTPSWGKEMPTGTLHSDGTKVYKIDGPLDREWGHFYGGIRLGWALYRIK